jgi:hypothetical protein
LVASCDDISYVKPGIYVFIDSFTIKDIYLEFELYMDYFLNPNIKISNFIVDNGNLDQFHILSNNPLYLIMENFHFKNFKTSG